MIEREKKLLVAQLLASRDALAATITQIHAALLSLGVDADDLDNPLSEVQRDCIHPDEMVVNHHTTLDDRPDDWECQACGARQTEPFHPSEG